MQVRADRVVPALPDAIWPDLADPARFAAWYAFCDAASEPEPGIRVLEGSWGSQRSAVTTAVTASDPPRRLAWRHVEERLDGRVVPGLAVSTEVEVRLDVVDGGTAVTITSLQVAAGWWQAAVMRLLGRRKTADMLRQSLTLLAARHGG